MTTAIFIGRAVRSSVQKPRNEALKNVAGGKAGSSSTVLPWRKLIVGVMESKGVGLWEGEFVGEIVGDVVGDIVGISNSLAHG